MIIGGEFIFLFICIISRKHAQPADLQEVEHLVKQWAPLIWMSPEENYMPLSAEEFINHVYVADENDILKNDTTSFLFGKNPNLYPVPIYAVVNQCHSYKSSYPRKEEEIIVGDSSIYGCKGSHFYFHVSYWMFFPYNEGKQLCFLGRVPTPRIFNRCIGHLTTMGNHVGDWEHVSLSFAGKRVPEKLYLSVHDTGVYYSYDERRRYFKYEFKAARKGVAQVPKFPEILRTQGHHPVIFSAHGSHGLWASSGEFDFIRVPRLIDKNGYGIPWKTWNNIKIYHLGKSSLPHWMTFGENGVIQGKIAFYFESWVFANLQMDQWEF